MQAHYTAIICCCLGYLLKKPQSKPACLSAFCGHYRLLTVCSAMFYTYLHFQEFGIITVLKPKTMKRTIMGALPALWMSLAACQPSNHGTTGTPQHLLGEERGPFSQPLPIDSANKMVESYLASVAGDDSSLHSLVFDADTLVKYLTDTSRGRIRKLKLMLAHRPGFINNGNYGRNAGYNINALTLVIAGCDENGDYVYNARNMVYDYCAPCPYNCPNSTDTLTPN
jgi:hypothetical protein